MSPSDEQRITTTYSLNLTQKKALVAFSVPIANLSMSPAEAIKMAGILLNCAKELDPESVDGYTWPEMNKPIERATAQ